MDREKTKRQDEVSGYLYDEDKEYRVRDTGVILEQALQQPLFSFYIAAQQEKRCKVGDENDGWDEV